jgi:hypothetical protein
MQVQSSFPNFFGEDRQAFPALHTERNSPTILNSALDNQLLYQHGSERGYEAAPADQVSARV